MNPTEKNIIKNVIDGVSSPENATSVVDWFSSSIEGQHYLSEMIDRDAYLLETASTPDISSYKSKIIFSRINQAIREKQRKTLFLRVAAVLIPFVLLLGLGAYVNSQVHLFGAPSYAEIYIPKGEKARILFQDGSEAYLNSDTKIRYPEKFGLRKREVFLEGEAYFQVASNKRRPFIVHAENASVKVLGTSFNVNAYENNNEMRVTLDEGRISFHSPINSYTIRPRQEIVYNKVTGEHRILSLAKSSNKSLWKENVIYLNDTPLSDVIKLLERKYDVHFDVKNPQALTYSYTLITRQLSVDSVLLELQKIAPVTFKKSGDTIEVFVGTAK